MDILITLTALFLISIWGYKKWKEDEKKEREELVKNLERIEFLKNLYQKTGKPILLSKVGIYTKQTQTRQLLTGALTYSLPKEFTLYITLENISDKEIKAIEIDILLINAFNETISSFTVSKRVSLIPSEVREYEWGLANLPDINNTITNLKRVLFTDGTFWVNKI